MLRLHIPLIKPDVRFSRIKCGAPHLMRYVAKALMWRPVHSALSLQRIGYTERHISSALQCAQECHQTWLVPTLDRPPVADLAFGQRSSLHLEIDFGVNVGRVE